MPPSIWNSRQMALKPLSAFTAAGEHLSFRSPMYKWDWLVILICRDRKGSRGYKVSKVDFANGRPVAPSDSKTAVIDIMSNIDVNKCGQIRHYVWNNDCFQPAGLAFDKAGRLFMSSDQTGEIWAITKVWLNVGFSWETDCSRKLGDSFVSTFLQLRGESFINNLFPIETPPVVWYFFSVS